MTNDEWRAVWLDYLHWCDTIDWTKIYKDVLKSREHWTIRDVIDLPACQILSLLFDRKESGVNRIMITSIGEMVNVRNELRKRKNERRAKEGLTPLPLLDVREVRMKCMEGQAKMESDWNLAKQNIAKMQREDAAAFAEYQKRNHPPEEEVEINGSVIR